MEGLSQETLKAIVEGVVAKLQPTQREAPCGLGEPSTEESGGKFELSFPLHPVGVKL